MDEGFYRSRISGRTNARILEEFVPHLPDDERRRISERKERAFRENLDGLRPLPGLPELLARGRDLGLALALVTNAPRENVEAVLGVLGLEAAFDALVLSEEVGRGKPDPAPYVEAARVLGVAPELALAFEDSTSGVASAVGAGVPTVGVATTQEPGLLERAGAFVVVRDFRDPALNALLYL